MRHLLRNTVFVSVAFTALATQAARAEEFNSVQAQETSGGLSADNPSAPWFGGSGGGTWGLHCTNLTGIFGRSGAYVDQLGIRCQDGSSTAAGGAGGGPFEIRCPSGYYPSGIFGSAGAYVDSLGFFCKNSRGDEIPSPSTGGSGGGYFEYECPAGMRLTGFNVRRGAYLDALQARCKLI